MNTQPIGIPDERRGGTSASNAHADSLCIGRHIAQKGIAEADPGKDAMSGREVHAALAKYDPSGLTVEQEQTYESCLAIESKILDKYFGPDKPTTFIEQRYWVKVRARIPNPEGGGGPSPEVADIDVLYEHSGQPDRVHRVGPKGIIIEFKTLPGEQQAAPDHRQIREQVVLAARNLLLNNVLAFVVQPWVTHDPQPVLYDEASIKQAEEEMFAKVRKNNDPTSPRTAGEVQCKFCRAKTICQEHAVWVASMVPAESQVPAALPVAQWTPEQRTLFCDQVGILETWIDQCRAELKKLMAKDEEAVPGYYLKPGAVQTPVNDPQELFTRFATLGGTVEAFIRCMSTNKNQFKTEVRELTKLKGVALETQIEKLFEGITSRSQNAPSIERK